MVSKLVHAPPNPSEKGDRAQQCSRMVLEYAAAFMKLLQLLFEQNLDLTRLWPLTGYGAFVVGSVFMVCSAAIQVHYRARVWTLSIMIQSH
jgi:hypothetical protein